MLAVQLVLLTACSDESPEHEQDASVQDWRERSDDLRATLERTGLTCDSWEEEIDLAGSDPTVYLGCLDSDYFNRVDAFGAIDIDVTQKLTTSLYNAKCTAVQLFDVGTDSARPAVLYEWEDWVVSVAEQYDALIGDALDGDGYDIYDPYPSGYAPDTSAFPDCDPSKYDLPEETPTSSPTDGSTPSTLITPSTGSSPQPTVVLGSGFEAGMYDCGAPATEACQAAAVELTCVPSEDEPLRALKPDPDAPEFRVFEYQSQDGETLVASASAARQFVSVESCADRPGLLDVNQLHDEIRRNASELGIAPVAVVCVADRSPAPYLAAYPLPVLEPGDTFHCLLSDSDGNGLGSYGLLASTERPYFLIVESGGF